ncbi:protein kinase domain-containing protein ppk38-like isoform X1 [Typha angustifolia]|uniref:protein kinase domain-containing protein ppk38-like isoform X1 n=1 Tax=Typha angustifolia TaxID=59011 RepID=UPI003C2B2354
MWRFKPFAGKEPAGLEGRTIDVGDVKVNVRNAIAEGGFSCVYIARDAVHSSKQYALKHMICSDEESLDLVMKEIRVMKLLKAHPNVVTLVSHTILDMGRMKEALLVMEFCEKSLVSALENRGSGYFEEKDILIIFRDICNAVFAMHNQSPPIAHRDLKAENILLGSDGAWKLCDFGSTSTNHKCFNRLEEMGIEEDNIRKHTTPAYRAPEMWDLYRREVISEKVDIWALGCLLYRICYFKSAFDGESKLQVLNGNYRIPDLPKYSSFITGLIKDMLEASPNVRPDITQVWFRVNEQLPQELQKNLPDKTPNGITRQPHASDLHDEGGPRRTALMPRRSPPPPPSSREQARNISPGYEKEVEHSRYSHSASRTGDAPIGAFWATQHAQNSQAVENKRSLFDEEPIQPLPSRQTQSKVDTRVSPPTERISHPGQSGRRNVQGNLRSSNSPTEDFEIRFFQDSHHDSQKKKVPQPNSIPNIQNETFNTFVAQFDTTKLHSGSTGGNINANETRRKELEAEVESLKEQLKKTNSEKAEITSKYEKLSAICRSQRQEIQELKHACGTATPSPMSKGSSQSQISAGKSQQKEKIEGTMWELQQGMSSRSSPSPSSETKQWQAFPETKASPTPMSGHTRPVGAINRQQNVTRQSNAGPSNDSWGSGRESFAPPPSGAHISRTSVQGSSSQRFPTGVTRKVEQPSGWAGF